MFFRSWSLNIATNSFIYAKTAPPQMISYQINVIPKWLIKNEPNYFVDDKNKVYNLKTGKALQMQLKGYTKGYYLSGCFYSLNKLIPLLIKIKTEKIPF
jgi:hypothetical protein